MLRGAPPAGWVDETLLMHPRCWAELQATAETCDALHGGAQLQLSASQLRDALLPPALLREHAALNETFAHADAASGGRG